MDCLACGGACCETMVIPLSAIRPPSADAARWLQLHGVMSGRTIEFECRCTKLTPEGRCGIYADRPQGCADFKPGSGECLRTVKARRTPEQYQLIRGEADPATL